MGFDRLMAQTPVVWSDAIAKISDEFKNVTVDIIDPSLVTSTFNVDTNAYTPTGNPVLASGIAARFQPVRMAVDVGSGAPAANSSEIRARVQIGREVYSGIISRGMRIRITAAARNPNLVDMIFYVDANVNSGWRASNTVEVTTNVINVES